ERSTRIAACARCHRLGEGVLRELLGGMAIAAQIAELPEHAAVVRRVDLRPCGDITRERACDRCLRRAGIVFVAWHRDELGWRTRHGFEAGYRGVPPTLRRGAARAPAAAAASIGPPAAVQMG